MIVLFGLAGSGKGTQSKALSEIYGWRWISTGQLIRDNGNFNHLIDGGNMISDEDVTKMLERELDKTDAEGYDVILDGYPRTAAQAEWIINREKDKLYGAIILDVPKDELYNRLYQRASLDGRVDDQEKSSIDRRFEIFEQNICSILPLFEAHNIPVVHVNGVGTEGEVTDRLCEVCEKLDPGAIEQNDDVNGGEIEKSYGE
ncbi:nucleoside monophosphate kinase [Candidatus Saccharibacteria bacterium]|nr:nucleoside monophosphate kinase [Candidatus Saccharibacteria bacterium]MBQ6321071.1 nucleoside monophosphate kinase [Candidatus Saccharibacteria bacterium]